MHFFLIMVNTCFELSCLRPVEVFVPGPGTVARHGRERLVPCLGLHARPARHGTDNTSCLSMLCLGPV